jgi:hypothetical protein
MMSNCVSMCARLSVTSKLAGGGNAAGLVTGLARGFRSLLDNDCVIPAPFPANAAAVRSGGVPSEAGNSLPAARHG